MAENSFRASDPGSGKSVRLMMPDNRLSQAEVDQQVATTMAKYLALDPTEARKAFAYQLQGFVAAEVERGHEFSEAMRRVGELIGLFIRANLPGQGDD